MKLGIKGKTSRWRYTGIFIALLVLAFTCNPVLGAFDTNQLAILLQPPRVKLHDLKTIQLAPPPPLSPAETAHISKLIANLANIDSPDFGLSATMSGESFAPIADAQNAGAFLLTDHRLKGSDDFKELVEIGPQALPFLLKALDDPTPTKLIINYHSDFGTMEYSDELWGNPGNAAEQKILATMPKRDASHFQDSINTYTVKIGDVCFVITGQIVGRPYSAVRYQPTACIIVNSPVHDTNLASHVRAIWSSPEPVQSLLNSYLLDFASIGVFNGISLNGWDVGSSFQTGPAMRLLYYFSQQTTNLIAARLHGLDAGNYTMDREVTNGVRIDEFIKAVAWSTEPAIQTELLHIIDRTSDPKILTDAGGAAGGANAKVLESRLEASIASLPETESGPYGNGYRLLVSLGQKFGPEVRPVFEKYLQNASLQRRRSLCKVLAEVHGEWSADLLGPVLADSRPADGWDYPVIPGQNEPRQPLRVCDEAAQTIAKNFPKLSFQLAGEHKDLDRQITKMRDQIARHDY